MNLLKGTTVFFLISLLNSSLIAGEGDTLKLKPLTPQKSYYQPLVIKTSPTALIMGGIVPFSSELRLLMEIASSRTQSEQVGVSYLFPSILFLADSSSLSQKLKVSGWRFQYAHKFYIIRKSRYSPYGFYVAPLVSYATAHISPDRNSANNQEYYLFRHFNINAVAGIQIGKFHRVTMDSYFGFGYKINNVFIHYASNKVVPYDTEEFGELYNMPLNVVFGINLGYSF